MSYVGEAREIGRNVASKASETFDFLKSAANINRSNSGDVLARAASLAAAQASMSNEPAVKPQPLNTGRSIVAINVEITGSITSQEDVHVHGRVEGSVRASSITVCQGGVVRGDVVAQTVIVHGTVEGRIFGQKVQLAPAAAVRGDIVHTSLGVDMAASFEGASRRSQDPQAEAPALPVRAAAG
jgi:cytoskeletal protein CcmA (bactofilin family)